MAWKPKKSRRQVWNHCTGNRHELGSSKICGCFYCLAIYSPWEIDEWADDNQTAICPKCGIDSVIGESKDYKLDAELLREMNKAYFM
jgi:hypothetical protein